MLQEETTQDRSAQRDAKHHALPPGVHFTRLLRGRPKVVSPVLPLPHLASSHMHSSLSACSSTLTAR
jgi:hypothetical protein